MPLLGFWQQPSNSFTVSKGTQGPFLSSPRPRRLRLPVLDAKAPASPRPGSLLKDLLGLPPGRLATVSLHLQAQRPGFRSRQYPSPSPPSAVFGRRTEGACKAQSERRAGLASRRHEEIGSTAAERRSQKNWSTSAGLGPPLHGIFQARILEWVATSFSRGSSQPRDQTWVDCIGRQILYR